MSLEKYTVGKVIGKGSYGEVFLAKHKKDKKQYVLKKVDLQKASIRERKAAELEAKLLSQLRHPNIVSYRESFQDDTGFLYIAMNFCEGGDLYSKLKTQKGSVLDENQIVEWFVQIAMALQYMHEKHILHRDLKTQNIFLTKSKIIKVGDLGIAKVLESSSDMATTLIGTPYYMSPELFSNKPYNHKSDVWALGCCLYEMCTLRHAFNAKDMSSLVYKILKGKTPPLPKQYSTDLCSIIKSMLDQDPDKRPSASRLLRHPYIKKQIALFLEGTKNRQRQKKNSSSGARIQELPNNGPSSTSSSKSDSGFGGSNIDSSIATVSAVDCVLDEPGSPTRPSPAPRQIKSKPSVERSSVDSTSSTSSSGSSDKGQTEIHLINADQQQKLERQKEQIRKQMSERRKSAAERTSKPAIPADEKRSREQAASKKPVHRVRSAGSDRSPTLTDEVRQSPNARPLPRPPVATPRSKDVPSLSQSPHTRKRYKVSSGAGPQQPSAEEEDDDDKSTTSIDSDRSLKSASEATPQSCSMSARERRRLRQKSAAPIPSPVAVSYNTPPLPSPRDLIAAARVRKSQECVGDETPKQRKISRSSLDSVDGPPAIMRPVAGQSSIESSSSGSESTGSDLEEISLDEPPLVRPQLRKHRHQSDVSSLISALDTTLKLQDRSSDDRVSPGHSPSPTEDLHPLLAVASPSTSGRLRDRIERLRSDCVRGIGEDQLSRALRIIDALDEDEVEAALIDLMGRENFETFGGAIWQLKFIQSFQIS